MADIKTLLAEIRAGLDGVTPGEWDVMASLTVRALHGEDAIPLFDSRVPFKKRGRTSTAIRQEWCNAHHVARMNPVNVAAILEHVTALEDENARLREALGPLAKASSNFDDMPIKNTEEWFVYKGQTDASGTKNPITVGDLRRARAALGGDNG